MFWGDSKAKYVSEALSMKLARESLPDDLVHVPAVLAVGVDEEVNRPFLVMERIDGVSLRQGVREGLVEPEAVARDLMKLVAALCEVRVAEPRRVESFGGNCGLCFDGPNVGPCDSVDEFVRRMLRWSARACDDDHVKELLGRSEEAVVRKISQSQARLVFRHGDLSIDNVMLLKGSKKLCLVDWEFAGVYDERDVWLETS